MGKAKKFWWVLVILALLVLSAAFGSNDNNTQVEEDPTATSSSQVSDTSESTADEENVIIELIAGEPGEYGELFTINKDTEFEETYYIYHVPDGTYTVTNSGEYMSQITVCSDEVHVTDAGWEEPVDVFYAKALDAGASDTLTIEDGQYIEIHEPAHFTLEKIA